MENAFRDVSLPIQMSCFLINETSEFLTQSLLKMTSSSGGALGSFERLFTGL